MSSLLEKFFILFESNADDVRKGADDARDTTDDLEDSLDEADRTADRAGRGFVEVMKSAKGALASLLAVGSASAIVMQGAAYANDLRLSAMAIGENVSEIEAWGRATHEFGGDANTLQGTLKSLNTSIRETAFTGEGSLSPTLRRLGLNLRTLTGDIKTPLQLLPEIAEAFEGMSGAESLFLGGQLGLDQGTILLLQRGRAEVEKLLGKQREFGLLTKEDTEVSKRFNTQLAETGNMLVSVRQKIVSEALPGLTWFLEKVEATTAFMVKHQPVVEGFFIAVATVVATYYMPAMLAAAAAAIAATWPILLIVGIVGALAAAFALAYDEVVNFSRGGNSLIGEAVKRWPLLGIGINAVSEALKTLGRIAEGVFGFFVDFIRNPVAAIKGLFETWGAGLSGFLGSIPLIGGSLSKLLGYFNETFGGIGAVIGHVVDLVAWLLNNMSPLTHLGKMADFINAPFKDSEGDDGMLAKARAALNLATSTPLASQTTSSVINSQTRQTRNFNIPIESVTIQTAATDAQGISAAVSTSLAEQMRQALYNFDDGVDA